MPPGLSLRVSHRGWLVVLGAFLIQVVGFGAIYSSAAFSAEIAATIGMNRADADLVMGLSLGLSFLVSAISGALADRFGPRLLAVFGVILVASGLAMAALAQSATTLFLGYGLLLGLGVGLANVPGIAAVQRWFLAKRGLAAGLAGTGMAGGMALVPILKDLLSPIGDWRAIFLCCAALAALIGFAAALLLDAQPEKHGMGPDGKRLDPARTAPAAEGLSLGQALRLRSFHYAVVGTLLVSIPASAPLMLLVGSAEAQGLSHHQAVGLLALIGIGSLTGRLLLAAVADRLGRRISFLVTCFALGLAMFAWAGARDAWSLGAFALIYGVLQGGFQALLPAFAADSFGSRAIGGLIGALYTSRGVALLTGLPLMVAGITFIGAYEVSIVVCGLTGVVGAFLLCLAWPESSGERRLASAKYAILSTVQRAMLSASERRPVLALWFLSLLSLGAGLLTVSPRSAAAEALVPDTAIRAANLPTTKARGGVRSFAVELADGTGVFDMPEAAAHAPVPAVLILHDASGADGRATAYAEQLLGADIAVLELREGDAAAAGAALAALATDPRINPARLGILGFGAGARLALELPGTAARALLYPGCGTLPGLRKMATANEPAPLAQRVAWIGEVGIRDFIGPAEYAWNYNVSGGAPGFALPHRNAAILLLHGAEDPANPAEACASLCEGLRATGAEVGHQEVPGAGYAWDYPQLGATQEVLLPAPGTAGRVAARPWPAMAAQTAATVAGFFAMTLAR
ncbi:MAG: MFS transporter [Acetobacteraceae bacterium]|nr:MFS transporter [Acetobacteraceae bacterium]